MGGRPSGAGFFAVAVALLLVAPFAMPAADAQIRIPLPGEDAKPKVQKKKRVFRPTAPSRNPNRVTAGIVANASSPSSGPAAVEAASAAGAVSSAATSVALIIPPKPAAPVETAALEQDTDTAASGDETEAAADPAEDSASADEQPAETAEAAPAEEKSEAEEAAKAEETSEPEESAQASEPEETQDASAPDESEPSADAASDSSADDAEESVAAAEESDAASATDAADATDKTDEKAEADQADASPDVAPEPTESAETAESAEPAETAEAPADESSTPDDEASASDTAEPEEPTKPVESADAPAEKTETAAATPADETAAADDAKQADEPEQTAAVPQHNATVVLQISPPPDEVMVAAVTPAEDDAAASDESPPEADADASADGAASDEEAEAKDEETTKVAAVEPTEIAAPEPETPAEDAKTTEDASETDDAAEKEDTADSEDSADQSAPAEEAASSDDADSAEQPVADDTAAPGEEAVSEEAAEPEPVPAHPIVAAVRANLAEPHEGVAAADLAALKAFYGAREEPPLWITEEGFTPKAQALIEEIGKADEWGLNAAAFDLPPPNDLLATPNAHADDELQLSIAVLKYARQAQGGRISPGQASTLFDQNPPLRDPEEVLKEIAASDNPSAYLVSLHPQHDQFKRLHAALKNARARADATGGNPDNDPNVQRILINMERWRWMPRSLGAFHVWNNIPEYEARVIKNGKIIYDEKTIVGQVKYATPFFSAPMRSIVFHPNWTVPPTIVKEDIAPKLQAGGGGGFFGGGSSQFLRRHGLAVSLAGQPVDADRVDWRNENVHRYTFTQDPGPANVLGKLKFNFPNRHAIYMHDTVQPELFAQRQRTLSHGCIRVQNPGQFATLLLAEDKGWSAGQVQRLLAGTETVAVSLNRQIPVHLTYFTVTVDESGNLRTFDDIYGIDNRMAAKMFKNPARFPVPGPPPILEASAPRERARSPQGGGLDSIISGLFGN